MLPIEAFWQDVKARGLGGGDPVWWGERKSGGVAQTVVTAAGGPADPDVTRFHRYTVCIACYHPDRAVAETRALAVYTAYDTLKGRSSLAPGLALSGWRAEQVTAELHGVTEALPITAGLLYKATVTVTLWNLSAV